MFLVFVDECGYQKNWSSAKNLEAQPVHVAAAVAIKAVNINPVYTSIRKNLQVLDLPHIDATALGTGQEIKAAPVDRGDDFWKDQPELRSRVRQIYLDHGEKCTYIVVAVDKHRHKEKYPYPDDPSNLCLKFLLERVQGHANAHNEHAIVLIDINRREEPEQRNLLAKLLRWGSSGLGISKFYGSLYQWQLEMQNIVEFHFGDSKYSLGLQVADFVARHAYSWWKSGKRPDYPSWSIIEPRLWRYPNHKGWGYKEFP